MHLLYTLEEISSFNSSIEKIVFSKDLRRLKNKTQLFSVGSGDHFRNRMTHTLEVLYISKEIGRQLELFFQEFFKDLGSPQIISFELLEAIALGHDLGHTPFGHIGERTLQGILSRKDNLGGLVHNISIDTSDDYQEWQKLIKTHSFFKHNANSVSILRNIGLGDWRILDGILKHTDISYTKDASSIPVDELNWLKFLIKDTKLWKIYFPTGQSSIATHALTLEGQIVKVADEIAQKHSDFDDMVRDNINLKLPDILPHNGSETLRAYNTRLLVEIKNQLIQSTVASFKKKFSKPFTGLSIVEVKAKLEKCDTQYFDVYSSGPAIKIQKVHDELFNEISKIRRFDGKSQHVVRQLFKAYYNNPALLDEKTQKRIQEDYKARTKMDNPFSECVKHMKVINCRAETNKNDFLVGNILLKRIAEHISYMTDDFALAEYSELYL